MCRIIVHFLLYRYHTWHEAAQLRCLTHVRLRDDIDLKICTFCFLKILASKKIFGDVSESDNDDDEDVKIKLESASATDGGAGGGGASDSNLDYSLPTAAMTEGRRQSCVIISVTSLVCK